MARVGPGGRLTRMNHYPQFLTTGTGLLSAGTSDQDMCTTLIMPGDGWIGHSTIHNSSPGTGTSLITIIWYTAAAAGGTALTGPHVDKSGNLVDLDVGGVDYAAEGIIGLATLVPEGGRVFLNEHFEAGTHTGGGSWEASIFLLL